MKKKVIIILSLILCVITISSCHGIESPPTELETLAQKIVVGQTHSEVCDILGYECSDIGSGAIIYEWDFQEKGKIRVWYVKNDDGDFVVQSVKGIPNDNTN